MGSGRALRRAFALRPVVRTHAKPEPLRLARVLRATRLELEAQSTRHVRRLESARKLRGRPILTTSPARRQISGGAGGGVLLRLHQGDGGLPRTSRRATLTRAHARAITSRASGDRWVCGHATLLRPVRVLVSWTTDAAAAPAARRGWPGTALRPRSPVCSPPSQPGPALSGAAGAGGCPRKW